MVAITKKEMDSVFSSILNAERDEIRNMKDPAELERYWFFKYDPALSLEWNTYQFNQMLELYRNKCRRWEEAHNGSCCVVERVRDNYLMPKIKEWISLIQSQHKQ